MLTRAISRISNKSIDVHPTKYVTKLDQDFEVGESLGEGGFGQIVKAKRKCDKNNFAVKIIMVDPDKEDVDTIRGEAEMLSKLNHNNIVRYYNSWVETAQISLAEYEKLKADTEEPLSAKIKKLSQEGSLKSEDSDSKNNIDYQNYDEEDDNEYSDDDSEEDEDDDGICFESKYKEIKFLYIQMELCDKKTLRTAIDHDLYLEESKAAKYFKEICEGLAYIHKNNIVHRDLKPENIFLTADDVIKIGDFGLSKQISLDDSEIMQGCSELPYGSLSAACGTFVYIAPELSAGNKFNVKADIYSLGVIYFEMCFKPMTDMEKLSIFPVTTERWKNLTFPNSKKKNLTRSLLNSNHHERPTCDQILKILNSDKSIDEIKEVIKQNKKVPYQELKNFENALKATSVQKAELTALFLSTAVKIFELHGGKHIPMPIFVPSFSHHSDNLTTLLNTRGNSTSISNTSRIAFSYYVANKRIDKIRRYSIGKIFDEGYFSPVEVQECLFEIVSPKPDDYVVDAEMLHIAEKVCNEILPQENDKIYFLVNHGLIFSSILKYCKISQKDSAIFKNTLINLSSFANFHLLFTLEMDPEVKAFLRKMMQGFPISEVEKIAQFFKIKPHRDAFAEIDMNLLRTAFDNLKEIKSIARKFDVKSEMFVFPLLINHRHFAGFTFTAKKGGTLLATGGRFETVINRCNRNKKRKPLNISAVELSFNVESILELLASSYTQSSNVDVVIVSKRKVDAVPLYAKLLSQDIKCEIVEQLVLSNGVNQRPSKVIRFIEPLENHCVVFSLEENSISRKPKVLFFGNWTEKNFLDIICEKTVPDCYPQITFPINTSQYYLN